MGERCGGELLRCASDLDKKVGSVLTYRLLCSTCFRDVLASAAAKVTRCPLPAEVKS